MAPLWSNKSWPPIRGKVIVINIYIYDDWLVDWLIGFYLLLSPDI